MRPAAPAQGGGHAINAPDQWALLHQQCAPAPIIRGQARRNTLEHPRPAQVEPVNVRELGVLAIRDDAGPAVRPSTSGAPAQPIDLAKAIEPTRELPTLVPGAIVNTVVDTAPGLLPHML